MLDSLDDYLRDVYKETRYAHHVEWPPVQSKLVVDNTLIHYKDKRTERELLDVTKHRRGASSVDEITLLHPSRATKSVASIFESPNQKFILIEGAPGIGKTVLVKEIAYLWACGEILQGKKLYLLFVRNPKLHDIDSINQQLISCISHDYLSESEIDVGVSELRKSRGQNIVFVIDGFDECPNSCRFKSFIDKLTEGEIFPKSMVVRSHASNLLRPLADQRIEILGFAKQEQEKYITESLKKFSDKEGKLKKYLKLQPTINSIMHIPLHLAILLYLFKEDSMPETLTELNEQFVIHTIYRHLKKQLLPLPRMEKISNLPESILKVINQLSKLAWSGLKCNEQKIVFTYDEVRRKCPEINATPNGFGLLQTVQHDPVKGVGSTYSFSFLHLSIQEFLAAYYLATLPNDVQLTMAFQKNLSEYVWLMYVGIVGVKSASFKKFRNTPSIGFLDPLVVTTNYNSHSKLLFLFQCYLEAKRFAQLPKNISSIFKDGYIHLCSETMQPCNIVSLINFIMKSSTCFTSIVLSNCQITDEGMQILQEFFTDHSEKTSSLQHVCLDHNQISSMWGTRCSACD